MFEWFDERLDLRRLHRKFLRKVFPIHHSFFLGEIALFAFVTLVATGCFLSLNYEASGRPVSLHGETVPVAYASVRYIDSLPFGRVLRSVHHWSAHVMIAAIFLHLLRVLLTGAYKRPREINWVIGLALLVVTMMTSFTGYSLPDDAFSVTATKIGYGLASSVPYVGAWVARAMFGGEYPSTHSVPRLHGVHILWLPLTIGVLLAAHLVVMVKQKHTQPSCARSVAPGRILGAPLVPHQALTSAALFLLYLGVLFVVGGLLVAHPVEAFGPPGISTPNVKPDWYFLWIYGVLELVPSDWVIHLPWGGVVGPELIGMLFPALLFLLALLLPFFDRTPTPLHYMELPSHHPLRTAITAGVLCLLLVASLAGYRRELGLSTPLVLTLLGLAPLATALVTGLVIRVLTSAGAAAGDAAGRGGGAAANEAG